MNFAFNRLFEVSGSFNPQTNGLHVFGRLPELGAHLRQLHTAVRFVVLAEEDAGEICAARLLDE